MPAQLIKLKSTAIVGDSMQQGEVNVTGVFYSHQYEMPGQPKGKLPPQAYDVVATYAEVAQIVQTALGKVPQDLVNESIKQLEAHLKERTAEILREIDTRKRQALSEIQTAVEEATKKIKG